MRLIDADSIHIDIYGGRMNGKTAIADALEKAFKEAPEVEAIPIKWLENFLEWDWDYLTGPLKYILEKWREEQEEWKDDE